MRPLTTYEASRIPEVTHEDLFLGDGHLAAAPSPSAQRLLQNGVSGGGSGGALSSGSMWREVVGEHRRTVLLRSGTDIGATDVVDHRTLIFDKPDTNATRAFVNGAKAPPGGRKYRDQRYAFDRVFDKTSTQEEVFDHTAKPLLGGLFDGFNATVFAYGATGCGKTHTVSGTKEDPGIIYRTMRELFAQVDESREQWDTQVTVSFLEIYNELIRDLLSDDFPACPRGGLNLREDEKNRITVAGLTLKQPKSAEEVLEYVLLGNSRRTSSPTHANSQSSRSHAVLQVNIARRPKGGDSVDLETETVSTNVSSATLSIIDLAGSERASATQNMGSRMKEGANINKSLLALGNCINALCVAATQGSRQPHIPYRNSKLTRLLKFSLGGNCRTVMIVCVSPCSVHLEDTGNTLKYANRAKNIVTKVSRNLNGIERNITQYLTAIAEKDATIKLLEAKLAEKATTSTAAQDRARSEMRQLKDEMKQKTAGYLSALVDGAEARAGWDAADLKMVHLKNRMAASASEAEKSFLQSLLRREETLHLSDPAIQQRLQLASKQSNFFDALLRSMQERRFDRVESSEVESVKLEAKLRRAEVDLAMAQAKEKAYRSALSQQGEQLSLLIGALINSSAADDTLAKILGVKPASVPDAKPISLPVVSSAPVPRRTSVAGGALLAAKASPAIRKLLGSAVRLSPRKGMLGSPSKRRPTAMRTAASVKKTLRWKDEAGAGRIDDANKTDSDRAPNSSSDEDALPSTPDVEDDDWVDDAPSEPSIRSDDGPASPTEALPAWKVNRMAIGRARPLDDSIESSPDAPKARLGGPPVRPSVPLQASKQPNLRASASMSAIRPTMTSMGPPARPAARAIAPTPLKSGGALNHRLSNIGPVRSEKKRSRPSAILPAVSENTVPESEAMPIAASRRISMSTASHSKMMLPPAAKNVFSASSPRRASVRASRPSLLRAPAPSMSPPSAPALPTLRAAMPTASSAAKAVQPSIRRVSSVGGSLASRPTAGGAASGLSSIGETSIIPGPSRPISMRSLNLLAGGG